MSNLLFLSHTQLKIHPRNIRIYYPPTEVEQMARSLAVTGRNQPSGNLLALLVVASEDEPGYYYVADGNLRLMAARQLGADCPPLKCEVVEASAAEQLLMMAATGIHFPKDPISEGRHYRRLIEEEGYTARAIAEETGLSESTIGARLATLDLDEPIQELIMKRELRADVRLVRALLSIPDPEKRTAIAQYYARRDVAIGTMVKRVRDLAWRLNHTNGNGSAYDAARERVRAKVEAAVEARRANRAGIDETSAQVIWRLAGEFLCEGCKLEGLSAECYLCPGPQEFIEHLVELAEARVKTESL